VRRGLLMAALLMAWAPGLMAQRGVLAEFSCSRPAEVDEGTAFNVQLACRLLDGLGSSSPGSPSRGAASPPAWAAATAR